MRELDKDHSQYTHMLKKIGGLMDSINKQLNEWEEYKKFFLNVDIYCVCVSLMLYVFIFLLKLLHYIFWKFFCE